MSRQADAAQHTLKLDGATIRVVIDGSAGDDGPIVQWVANSGQAVTRYFGRFPVPALDIIVRRQAVGEVSDGVTFGMPHPTIRVSVGSTAGAAALRNDWVLTHEMADLAFPDLTADDSWAEEGLSTYVEPIARANSGLLTVDEVWSGLLEGIPNAKLGRGRRGLHGTADWGLTYWGGALFWLLADIEIHERTGGRRGLRDALSVILDAGGDIRAHWPLRKALGIGDRALGVTVLSDLYARLAASPGRVDVADLWKRLGVRRTDRRIAYDDTAPLAAVRKDIAGAVRH